MTNLKNSGKLSVLEKMGYSMGDFASSSVWQTLMFFLPVFYTDTFGIPAAAVGTMFLVVRLFDAFNDPIMGVIADRTRTKWGSFRPYLLWFAAPYAIVAVLMFSTPDLSVTGKIVYAYITYTIMMVIYTAINVPFGSIIGVMSPSSEERTSVSSYRMVFAYGAGLAVQAFLIPMVEYLGKGDEARGYQLAVAILGLFAFIFFLVAFFTTKERVKPDPQIEASLKLDIKELFKNRNWFLIFLTNLFLLIYVAIRSSVIIYYFDYYVGNKELASAFMVAGTFSVLVGVMPTNWLVRKMGKRMLFIVSLIIIVISQALFFIADPTDIVLLFALQIIFSLASGPSIPLFLSMIADTIDYTEWKSGRRATGLFYSAVGIAGKSGFAIGGAITMWILTYYGYVANMPQTDESIFGIRLLLSIIPAVMAAICIVPLIFYNLTEKQVKTIEIELQERKSKINAE